VEQNKVNGAEDYVEAEPVVESTNSVGAEVKETETVK
jgi:hypothetical protein